MVLDQAAQIVEERGQVELDRLAAALAEGIGAGETGAQLVAGLAERVPAPAEQTGGLALPESELVEGIGMKRRRSAPESDSAVSITKSRTPAVISMVRPP